MTSFGLDEIVLKKLLEDAKVPKEYQIYVFYDPIKHLNPGFLQCWYPNSKIIGIKLKSLKNRKFRCPVFHSKVWMVLSRERRICRLAVHSINLMRYHLASPEQTIETFWFRKNLDLRLPPWKVFQLKRFKKKVDRISISPETWVIEESKNGNVGIKLSKHSVGDIIRETFRKNNHGNWLMAAAPFVNTKALSYLNIDPKSVSIRSGFIQKKGRTLVLHAKVLIAPEMIITGSANLTQQALMVSKKPVNHETILLINRKGKTIINCLKEFPEIETDQEIEECPGDYEGNIPSKVWEERRKLADEGPERVWLEIDQKRLQAMIRIKGKLDGAKYISLKSESSEIDRPILLRVRKDRIEVPQKKQFSLAAFVQEPPVEVEGKLWPKGKSLWYRELDLGDLWKDLPFLTKTLRDTKISQTNDHKGGDNGIYQSHRSQFIDIREIRDFIIEKKNVDTKWLRWFLRFQNHKDDIPDWIYEVKK